MSYVNKKNSTSSDDGDGEDWLTTYADSITLLLCFFVLLLSVSEPNMDKFESLTEGLASGFVEDMIELPFKTVHEEFQLIIEENAVELDVATEFTDQGVRLDMNASTLFYPGTAKIRKEMIPMLEQMNISIQEMEIANYRVEVEGHTDDTPIKSKYFPSNWELSAARSASVVRFFIENGMEARRLKASGYADTRPKVPNLDAQGNAIPENREINRRVLIHVKRVMG